MYSGPRPTKFGIFPEQLDDALAIARKHDLTIDTVHFHVGDGYLNDGLPDLDEVVRRVAQMVRTLQAEGCPIAEVNTGGGLGVPQRAGDLPLDLDRWAAILAEHLGPLGVAIGTEPGDFLVKECAINLAEVVTVEERDGLRFVGLDVGWNAMGERFIYHSLLPMVLCRSADAPAVRDVTISGHINEGQRPVRGGPAVPRRRGGRHRRGAQRGQLQRVHDVGALPATGGHIRVLHGPDLTDMLGEMSA